MRADARIEADAFDDFTRVHVFGQGIAVQLVEESHPQRQVGIGKKLDRFRLCRSGVKHRHILGQGPLHQQIGKDLCLFPARPDHDPRGIEVVMQRLTLAQEFGAKDDVLAPEQFAHPVGKADGHGRFDHDGRGRIDLKRQFDHRFHRGGVEEVGFGVVIRRRRDHDETRFPAGGRAVDGGRQVQFLRGQPLFQFHIFDRRGPGIQLRHALRRQIHRRDSVVLGQQDCVRQTHVPNSKNSNFH